MSWIWILAGVLWFVLTVLLPVYITGYRMSAERQVRLGFRLMAGLYLAGAVFLFILATVL